MFFRTDRKLRLAAVELVLAFAFGMAAVVTTASGQEISALGLSKPTWTLDEEVGISVRLRPSNDSFACGMRVSYGDGSGVDVKGTEHKGGVIALSHRYASNGTYTVRVEGKSLIRGLNSLPPCAGTRQVQVVVAPPKPACVPPSDEFRAIECPAGTSGKIVQKRSFACPGPVPGPWVTESTDCRSVPVAAPQPKAPPPPPQPAPAARSAPRKMVGE